MLIKNMFSIFRFNMFYYFRRKAAERQDAILYKAWISKKEFEFWLTFSLFNHYELKMTD